MLSKTNVLFCKNLGNVSNGWLPELVSIHSEFKIDRLHDVQYDTFFMKYFLQNKPCILTEDHTSLWKSRIKWVTYHGKPNLQYLSENFGEAIVPVADCDVWEYDAQKKKDMQFSEYVDYWRSLNTEGEERKSWYLKDWHFNRAYPSQKVYQTPHCFSSDWLNEFCEHGPDDYQFVYMGPKGTWTPLHADVFGSYSWSANICGRKKWILFPPGTEEQLTPLLKNASYQFDVEYDSLGIEVIQEPGEIIFVPSGWYHQVWNLDDVISINHNWFNGCNIHHIWNCMVLAYNEVTDELADIKGSEGWEEQCQAILKVHHGMNYEDYFNLLNFIATSRLAKVEYSNNNSDYWLCVFDIMSVNNVLSTMASINLTSEILQKIKSLTHTISEILSSVE